MIDNSKMSIGLHENIFQNHKSNDIHFDMEDLKRDYTILQNNAPDILEAVLGVMLKGDDSRQRIIYNALSNLTDTLSGMIEEYSGFDHKVVDGTTLIGWDIKNDLDAFDTARVTGGVALKLDRTVKIKNDLRYIQDDKGVVRPGLYIHKDMILDKLGIHEYSVVECINDKDIIQITMASGIYRGRVNSILMLNKDKSITIIGIDQVVSTLSYPEEKKYKFVDRSYLNLYYHLSPELVTDKIRDSYNVVIHYTDIWHNILENIANRLYTFKDYNEAISKIKSTLESELEYIKTYKSNKKNDLNDLNAILRNNNWEIKDIELIDEDAERHFINILTELLCYIKEGKFLCIRIDKTNCEVHIEFRLEVE